MTMDLTSSAFAAMGDIPRAYTCAGDDRSPPLVWSDVPAGTQSLALVVDDPDAPDPAAPKTIWVHWVVYNLPPDAAGLAEAASGTAMPAGAREGINDWHEPGYRGPCPPIGRHRYFHKLYALDTVLPDLGPVTKAELEKAMKDHIVDQCELVGHFAK